MAGKISQIRFRLFIKELTGNSKVMPVEKIGKNATDLLVVAEDLSKSIAKRGGPLRVRGIRKVVKRDKSVSKANRDVMIIDFRPKGSGILFFYQ